MIYLSIGNYFDIIIEMKPFELDLFKRGYIKLQPGSYNIWISKKWHEMFVRTGLVVKNFYGQYVPYKKTLQEFMKWSEFYDKVMHDREFPKSKPFLTEEERIEIRARIA